MIEGNYVRCLDLPDNYKYKVTKGKLYKVYEATDSYLIIILNDSEVLCKIWSGRFIDVLEDRKNKLKDLGI